MSNVPNGKGKQSGSGKPGRADPDASSSGSRDADQEALVVRRREAKDRDHPFTQVSNRTLGDGSLSWKATGLLCYLLSLPPGWKIRMGHLVTLKVDGRDSLQSAFRELERQGYIVRTRSRKANGQFVTETQLNERPRKQKSRKDR